jgi:hypothetical protein
VTRLGAGWLGFDSRQLQGRDFFLVPSLCRLILEPTQSPLQLVPGLKWPEREADHSPPCSAEIKNAWSSTSTPPICLHDVVLIKQERRLHVIVISKTHGQLHFLPGYFSPGVKRPGREADHSLPSSVEVNNAWNYTTTPPHVFNSWYFVKHRDSCTFTLLGRDVLPGKLFGKLGIHSEVWWGMDTWRRRKEGWVDPEVDHIGRCPRRVGLAALAPPCRPSLCCYLDARWFSSSM